MARHKEFDPDNALLQARNIFWEKGYAATSINDLVKATGVQRSGLYSAFGDKHSLFLQSLDHYVSVSVASLLKDMESEDASWSTITAFFENHLEFCRSPQGKYGCLMCNSAMELASHDVAVLNQMDVYLDRLYQAFFNALTQARQSSDLRLTFSPADGATYLSGVAVGLFNLSKTAMPRQDLNTYVRVALAALKAT